MSTDTTVTHETIWVSDLQNDTLIMSGFRPLDEGGENWDAPVRVAYRRIGKGQPLDAGMPIPLQLYATSPYETKKKLFKLPDIFHCGGGPIIVREPVADLIGCFKLGATKLYPVQLYLHDKQTAVPGVYFMLHPGVVEYCFDIEQSVGFIQKEYNNLLPDEFYPVGAPKDGNTAIRLASVPNFDLWKDPHVPECTLFKDSLFRALKDAGFARRMRCSKCRLI
jgi:hypothetical protein